ncbi:glycosyltransferase [candidate division NPL-UPA2 bacterium Unc8]|uniref:Glycosyltransferase n=1 Tax=candidate division NPL-UPA2 bacterium Unc8 TaxID=1980939 RepID=A0A399FZ90_UNCN2|nr:Hyaluronan synthase [Bacillota bacterium]MBT9146562.1 Hyaluronan synthase [Bacillota bacterium]RII00582.1 MAG: glycosyltransferase [candidate division NPL-UPA2 bacterium Unc8]
MKVGIIITTYDNPSALERVLKGLNLQTRLPDEVIIADDGSGNETATLISTFKERASFPATHLWQEDSGFRPAEIRNKAIKCSSSDYLIILDGDCIPNKHFVADHILMAEKGCFFQGKRVLVGKKVAEKFMSTHTASPLYLLRLIFYGSISNTHHLLRMPFFPSLKNRKVEEAKSCNMGIFRDDLLAVNGFNEEFVGWGREDSELTVRLYRYGLIRKMHPFIAICFHLWHSPISRENLSKNDAILQMAINSKEYFCKNGIVKK